MEEKKMEEKKDMKEKKKEQVETENPAPAYAPATVVVTLPAGAKLYFNDRPTAKTTDRREFETPLLDPGMSYRYTLRAEAVVNGKLQVQSKVVEVRAGKKATVFFTFPTSVAGK